MGKQAFSFTIGAGVVDVDFLEISFPNIWEPFDVVVPVLRPYPKE